MTDRPPVVVSAYSGADDDAALVARVVAGEKDAFDALFQKHYARVYNFAAQLTGSLDAAEDIAQSVFIRAYGSLGRLRDGRAFVKLLYRTAVNLVRDRAKSARRKPWIAFRDMLRSVRMSEGLTDEPVEFADQSLDPARVVGERVLAEALREQIAALPPDFREALVLHHIEGLDVSEIAEIAGVPVGTVKSRLGRARRRLRDTMGDWVEQEETAE